MKCNSSLIPAAQFAAPTLAGDALDVVGFEHEANSTEYKAVVACGPV